LLGDGSFNGALRDFNKKFRDKASLSWEDRTAPPKKGKYTYIERSYEPDSSDDEDSSEKLPGAGGRRGSNQSEGCVDNIASKLEVPVQDLMELIFNQQHLKEVMADMNYDAEKLPLGKLSKRTIEQGYEYLKVFEAHNHIHGL
jgi:poly [ADP-ribose] polymerase